VVCWVLGELLEFCILGGVVLVGVEVSGIGEEGGEVRGEGRELARGCPGGAEEVGMETVSGAAMG
jgi:hypothetical protein